jgi:hypothetical protein
MTRISLFTSGLDPDEENEYFDDGEVIYDELDAELDVEPDLPERRIFKAVDKGDVEELRRLLEDEEASQYMNHFDEIALQTPLMRAVESANVEMVAALVETGKATIRLDDESLRKLIF